MSFQDRKGSHLAALLWTTRPVDHTHDTWLSVQFPTGLSEIGSPEKSSQTCPGGRDEERLAGPREGGIREISEPGQRTRSHKAHHTAVSRCQGSPGGVPGTVAFITSGRSPEVPREGKALKMVAGGWGVRAGTSLPRWP